MGSTEPFFILAGNGPYENRGCEAIVRGTVEILRNNYNNPNFLCISHFHNDNQFKKQCHEEIDHSILHKNTNRPLKKYTFQWSYNKMYGIVSPTSYKGYIYREMTPYLNEAEAVLSIGGDNYSLDYGIPKLFTGLDDFVLKKGKPLVIWGASVGPFDKNPKYEKYMVKHLHDVTAVFAREDNTVEYLAEKGLVDNVYRVSDPAFLMEIRRPEQKDFNLDIEKDAIGINLSPLMARYTTRGDIDEWIKIAANIISQISKKTSCKIYLIPHVTSNNENIYINDYLFLRKVLETINCQEASITLIPPIYNASEIKWIISKMSIFAGARTHSTIAALSSSVPTLSFAYSIKAKGINEDVFGHSFYCLNPNDLKPDVVANKIKYMLDNRKKIKNELDSKIPYVQKNALIAGKYLKQILS
ncbi:polysaccharide pyruvyl transferase family protein [Methanococcoides seepicolus]|uniref:Polysaccharide pyruvyl transferase family protein n=1 Tax=Methanococcoides seepicolus TaxID=2828780 RepID=A0A9E4ZFL5_9EURY|nr:polysaccharide pyruvyl transferase family protein [Methanococcoides seepicolus]MCM1986701.1 polysaccharide pyruvyl transferase family protein [Methanococcoides seepicolus]